jgi:hypothetical protein
MGVQDMGKEAVTEVGVLHGKMGREEYENKQSVHRVHTFYERRSLA